MPEARSWSEDGFRAGAVRAVKSLGKRIAQLAKDLGINEGTLGNWVARDRAATASEPGVLDLDELAELARLRREVVE